ncbi:hypothetical protein ACT3CE_13580 [Marinifilum sp. RC60d5]|uniref:hypothetical protein n=1 Tax=Marinifilum sp. RC60d5 TaxID=3458414 RepID=UPI00403699C6
MIASTIGRTFLKVYNEKTGNNYTAKEFFEKEYFETFYNHPKYMQWVTNSPFVQMKAGQKPHLLSKEERKEKLQNLHKKIDECEADASIAIGFPASETKEFATTSGAVTDINIKTENNDVYFSWIGGGLSVGIAGGYSIYFNNPNILFKLYEGWKIYRNYLNDQSLLKLRGNQINTWNGQWLNFAFNKRFREDFDFTQLHTQNVFSVTDKVIEVNTINWSELFFNISNKYPQQTLTGYVFSLGQTNKTLGFYPFHFDKAKTLIRYYKLLFGEQAALNDAKDYESLFGIHIKRACELGSIGLQALEPKNLRKYFGNDSTLKLSKPKIKQKGNESDEDYALRKSKAIHKDYENIITYRTYKTWLLAMITKNKEESLEYTNEVAKALLAYREKATKLDRKNLIQSDILGAKSKKAFINALVTIISEIDENGLLVMKQLRDRVHMMSAEDFGYFVVLLKFDYAYEERNS